MTIYQHRELGRLLKQIAGAKRHHDYRLVGRLASRAISLLNGAWK